MKAKLPKLPKLPKKAPKDPAAKAVKTAKPQKQNAFIAKLSAFWSKFGFGVSISKRIILTFSLVMVGFAAVVLFLLIRTIDFSNQYNGLLENTYYLNDIKSESGKQALRISKLCSLGTAATNDEAGIIDEMITNATAIIDNIGTDVVYSSNRQQAEALLKRLEDYKTAHDTVLELGGGSYSPKGNDQATTMTSSADMIGTACDTLLELEITRSANVQEQITADFSSMIVLTITMFIIILVVCIVSLILLRHKIVTPINKLKDKTNSVSEGDLSGEPVVLRSKDEFASLAKHFNIMIENIREIIGKVSDVGDKIRMSSEEVNDNIAQNTKMSFDISEQMEEMKSQIGVAGDKSQESIDQAEAIRDISTNIVERADRINDSAKNAMELATSGDNNLQEYMLQLSEVNQVIYEVADTASTLSDKAALMNNILNTITDISSQTNLLSLNASIEAARAGEAGRGFAVVANEIRNLADDTQKAAAQIGDIINDVQNNSHEMNTKMKQGLEKLQQGNTLASDLQVNFNDIKSGTLTVSQDVSDIHTKLEQLADMIDTVVMAIRDINSTIQDNLDVATGVTSIVNEETENMAHVSENTEVLSTLAEQLEQLVSRFSL